MFLIKINTQTVKLLSHFLAILQLQMIKVFSLRIKNPLSPLFTTHTFCCLSISPFSLRSLL